MVFVSPVNSSVTVLLVIFTSPGKQLSAKVYGDMFTYGRNAMFQFTWERIAQFRLSAIRDKPYYAGRPWADPVRIIGFEKRVDKHGINACPFLSLMDADNLSTLAHTVPFSPDLSQPRASASPAVIPSGDSKSSTQVGELWLSRQKKNPLEELPSIISALWEMRRT